VDELGRAQESPFQEEYLQVPALGLGSQRDSAPPFDDPASKLVEPEHESSHTQEGGDGKVGSLGSDDRQGLDDDADKDVDSFVVHVAADNNIAAAVAGWESRWGWHLARLYLQQSLQTRGFQYHRYLISQMSRPPN